MNCKAFTLIELLVVVAIIGILAAVGVVAYNGYTASAKKAVVKTNLKQIEKYINNEMMKCVASIEMEAYEKGVSGAKSCSYITSEGTEFAFHTALNGLIEIDFSLKIGDEIFEEGDHFEKESDGQTKLFLD